VKLENVTAEIRPRVPWESIDLGCALARRHIGAIWKAWSLTVVPLWFLLAILLRHHPVWFILVVWWLKPIYDRVPLFVVSRALFGDVPSVKDVLKVWPRLLVKRLWFALVIGRFSPSRSLTLPISELEGLRGLPYRQRVNLLERNGGEGAAMATLVAMVLEVVAALGLVLLVFYMVPAEISEKWKYGVEEFFAYSDFYEVPNSLLWLVAVVQMMAITLMEAFYVSAGFALYINSRTLTEGWDIELAFKRMGARLESLRKGAGVLLFILASNLLLTPSVNASEDSPKDQISEILSDDDFTIHHRIVKVPVEREMSWSYGGSGAGLALFGSVLFYLILIGLIVGLVYLIYRNRHIFLSGRRLSDPDHSPKTREVMGMDVSPESLPADVVMEARKAWESGDYQGALSLLYRGAIVWLIHRADAPIGEGDTEGDCLRHVEVLERERTLGVDAYFSNLTHVWMGVAYGKLKPEDATMRELCDAWPFAQQGRRAR